MLPSAERSSSWSLPSSAPPLTLYSTVPTALVPSYSFSVSPSVTVRGCFSLRTVTVMEPLTTLIL